MERPLTGLERLYWLGGLVAPINATAVLRLRGRLDEDALRGALDWAARRHPMLRVRIAHGDGAPPRFTAQGVGPVPLRRAPRPAEGSWVPAATEEMNGPFPPEGPLVRLLVLAGADGCDLILTFHHAVLDALRAYHLMQEVLQVAAGLQAGQRFPPAEAVPAPAPTAFLPPPEAPQAAPPFTPRMLPRDGEAPLGTRSTRIVPRALDPDVTARLVARCKAERATPLGAVCAAALLATSRELGEAEPGLALGLPVSLRPLLPREVGDPVGCYASGITVFARVAPKAPFWDLARSAAGSVRAAMDRGEAVAGAWAMEALPTTGEGAAALMERLDKLPLPAVRISNIGALPAGANLGGIAAEEFHFCAGGAGAGPTWGAGMLTFRGRLVLDFGHPEPLVSRARADRLVQAAMEALQDAAR